MSTFSDMIQEVRQFCPSDIQIEESPSGTINLSLTTTANPAQDCNRIRSWYRTDGIVEFLNCQAFDRLVPEQAGCLFSPGNLMTDFIYNIQIEHASFVAHFIYLGGRPELRLVRTHINSFSEQKDLLKALRMLQNEL
jgi:hypothetical protein